jgi:hypothetical protein
MGITLARRSCFECRRIAGFALWRWSGQPIVTTHVLCEDCLRALSPLPSASASDRQRVAPTCNAVAVG